MNIVEILDELGVHYRRHGESKDVRARVVGIPCPFCGRGEYSFGIFQNGATNCWRCGKHSLAKTLAEVTGRRIGEIRQMLGEMDVQIDQEPDRRGTLVIPKGIGPLTLTHIRYLEKRGLNSAEIEDVWGVQGIAVAPRLAWRLFIPVKDITGRMVSWTTRSLLDCKDRRFISASPEEEIVSMKSVLYGEELAGHGIVVVEGPTGAWRIGPGGTATLGASWTTAQANRIAQHPVRVICFDREDAAQQRAEELCHAVKSAPGKTLRWMLETGDDPGTCSDEEIQAIRAKAGI